MKLLCSLRAFAGLAIVVAATLALTVAASPAASNKRVYWIDLAGQAKQHPDFVYFTANSGGQVHDLTWRNWGGRKTVGRGIFHDNSPSYPGKLDQEGPAKLVASKPVPCTPLFGNKKGKTVRVYRHVKLYYPDGKGGTAVASVFDRAGWLTCKEAR